MKKVLFGSTALVAAAVAAPAMANDVNMTVGGFFVTGVGVGQFNGDVNVEKDFHIIRDGEIQFKGSGTLDNGLRIGVRVELEAFPQDTTQIDETFMTIDGTFGQILIGTNDNAAYNVGGYTGNLGSSIGMGSWDGGKVFVPGAIDNSFDEGDDMAVHYYIPNIAGFEAGVSWSPTAGSEADDIDTDDDPTNSEDLIAVGASYTAEFDGGSFTIGGGYLTVSDDADEFDDTSWGVGAELAFGQITIGGRYSYDENEIGGGGDTEEITRYGGGIVYATGPWEFGLNAAYEDRENDDPDLEEERIRVNAGVTYELGDGVALGLGVDYGELDFADDAEEDLDGFGGALLLGVNF